MPKNQINKEEIKIRVLKLKDKLSGENQYSSDPKGLANKYLNEVLDILDEYRY
jgi:hypothetical protein